MYILYPPSPLSPPTLPYPPSLCPPVLPKTAPPAATTTNPLPFAQSLLLLQSDVQDRPAGDVLHNRILSPTYVDLYLFNSSFLHGPHKRRVNPDHIQMDLGEFSNYISCNLVVEPPQGPCHAGGHKPHLRPKYQSRLGNHYVKAP